MNTKKNKTSITPKSRKEMKPRGRSKRTLILEAIKEKALLEMDSDSSNEDAEKAVFGFMAEAAFNPTQDTAAVSNTCLSQLMKKGWSDLKPVMPCEEFTLNKGDSLHNQAADLLIAVSEGKIAPDVASTLITSISSMLKIKEVTDLEDRIKALEAMQDE
jgi:ethanolamine utilization cobalamin adenosyltransferase